MKYSDYKKKMSILGKVLNVIYKLRFPIIGAVVLVTAGSLTLTGIKGKAQNVTIEMTEIPYGTPVSAIGSSIFGDAEVANRSLVKLTREEIDEIKQAGTSGLVDAYLNSGYVYYVDGSGNGLGWNGFYGGTGAEAPYMTCPLHTEGYFAENGMLPGEDDEFGEGFQDDNFGYDDEFAFPDDMSGWHG